MTQQDYQPFKIKSSIGSMQCELAFVEKLFEVESMMILAIEDVFLESVQSHIYGYLCVLLDYIRNTRIVGQNIINLEIKTPETATHIQPYFYLNTQIDPSTMAYLLLDMLFKAESLANIGNKYIFLENLDADKTNFLAAVGVLLSQLRELFERWLLINPAIQQPFSLKCDMVAV